MRAKTNNVQIFKYFKKYVGKNACLFNKDHTDIHSYFLSILIRKCKS